MSEPTIDELLAEVGRWESFYTSKDFSDGVALSGAIRAILEQHRNTPKNLENVLTGMLGREIQLEAIRAFVGRVEKRWQEQGAPYWSAIDEELAAMEREAEERVTK